MTDDDELYYDASDRLQLLGLGEGHQWVYFNDGDCWHGEHTTVMCRHCGAVPVYACYHELPYPPGVTDDWLSPRGITVKPGALAPCPGPPS